jgi:DNA-binding response OmpR family regulator
MATILVVDDRPDARYATVHTLEAAGHDVRQTASGRDALRLARLRPHLIILDIALQDTDGFGLCAQLKADALTAPIPVLMKTAVYDDPEHRRRGLAAGADEYLVDPVSPEHLLSVVDALLRNAGH